VTRVAVDQQITTRFYIEMGMLMITHGQIFVINRDSYQQLCG
jgi:hypothetical protein